MDSFEKLINDCESALRSGRVGDAIQLLQGLTPSKIPREQRLAISRLCRRCDQTTLGLKVLDSVIHPEKKGNTEPATDSERAEFAALRLKIGSVDEALMILSQIDERKTPEAAMLRAFCHMAQWNYRPASLELKKYLALTPESYSSIIARVNLAASLISIDEMDEALALLENLVTETKEGGYHRLRANCYELRSQIHLNTEDYQNCQADLLAASEILDAQPTADQLYIQKWLAVLESRKSKSQAPLLKIKKEALKRHNWETAREMDFQILKLNFDQALFEHLLWGTPWPAYRERVCRALGQSLKGPSASEHRLGDANGLIVDLRQAQVTQGNLNPGKQVHRLLLILLQDFYKPISVGALYASLFPGEYYNVFSSSGRLHQSLHRGRVWLKENNIPARIEEVDGRFRLCLDGAVMFILSSSATELDSNSVLLERLRMAMSNVNEFTSAEVGQATGVSQVTAVRFLNWAIKSGHLEKQGVGRATRYAFAKVRLSEAG